MAVLLSPVGGVAAQFFTNAGVPLSGGKIYTYAAGTSTPQATYTTGAGNIQHSNPIILDAAGRVPTGEIWLTDGLSYKFVLKDANDVLIATYDNIVGINSNFVNFVNQQEIQTATAGQTVFTLTTMQYQPGTGNLSVFVDGVNQYGPGAQYAYTETSSTVVTFVSGLHVGASVKFTTTQIQNSGVADASQITYTYPDANAVEESVETRLAQYVSVKDFGAKGDGVTDDTIAIQNAIDATQNQNKTLVFPDGIYQISSELVITGSLVLQGQSSTSTIVRTTSATSNVFSFDIGTSVVTGCGVENINIISTVAKTNGSYIQFVASAGGSFYKNFVRNLQTDANAFVGIYQNAGYFIDFQNVTIGGVTAQGRGFELIGINAGNEVADIYMSNCRVLSGISGGTTIGFRFGSFVEGVYCYALIAESPGLDYGFVFDNSLTSANYTPKNMWFTNCIADNAKLWNWYMPVGQSMHLTSCWGTSAITGGGIYLGSNAVDVTLEDFSAIANGGPGVELENSKTVKIVNSTITGNSATASNTNNGIYVKANTNDFIVSNCRFSRYGATPSHFADIYIETGTSNNYIIHDNNLDGHVTTSISDGGTGNAAKVHDNINYNPATTMGFPIPSASPYTYTAGHTPETVYFSGGTISRIDYLGQPLFTSTNVGIPLGPNESLVVTYSVVPTIRVVRH